MSELNEAFWSERYQEGETGWDLGSVSPPIKAYFDQIENKEVRILIPGCGNAYEAEYLFKAGFKNVFVLDLSPYPLSNLQKRVPEFPSSHCIQGNFFEHEGSYDYIIEQTMFCAIDPTLRSKYVETAKRLLKDEGQIVGLMFNAEFETGPPFGGTKEEYFKLFGEHFSSLSFEQCYNSVQPRKGREFFVQVK